MNAALDQRSGSFDRITARRRGVLHTQALIALAASAFAAIPAALATPFSYGEGVKPLRWPANKTIRIYIDPDPVAAPPDTSQLLKEGMERWQAEMAPRGITIEVNLGAPPNPPPANTVRCQYKPVGSRLDGDTEGEALGAENHGLAGCGGPDGGNINSAQIIIRNDIWAASGTNADGTPNGRTDAERSDYIRNLGQHEITHVLGLADDTDGTVTDHIQTDDPNTFNDHDRKEISTLYPLPAQPEDRADGAREPTSNNQQHNYRFQYVGSPNGHVPLIGIDIHPSVISQIIPPSGWIVLDPRDPGRTNPNHPYYQNYLEDGRPRPAPYSASASPAIWLRALNGPAALSPTRPVINIVVLSVNNQLGPVSIWSGGSNQQSLQGPIPLGTPVPATTWLGTMILPLGLAVAAAWVLHLRRTPRQSRSA